jgi:hypothetical protein
MFLYLFHLHAVVLPGSSLETKALCSGGFLENSAQREIREKNDVD